MKASLPFFSRSTLTSLIICAALGFSGVSSFADTVDKDSGDLNVNSDPIDASRQVSVFDRDYLLAHGRRAYYDSEDWFNQQDEGHHLRVSLRGFAELRDADADDWVMSNVSGSVSNSRPITLTGIAASQTKSAALADPPTPAVPAVPEPGTLALFGSGLCGIALTMRRKFRRHH
jgi:hypothetical protein